MNRDFSSEEIFRSYQLFQSLKLHFSEGTYDALKYNFKTNATPKSFYKRKDKYKFYEPVKKYPKDILNYYVYNFIEGARYPGDMNDENYIKHKRTQESLLYTFTADVALLADNEPELDGLLKPQGNRAPKIIDYYLSEDIQLETIVIMNKLTWFMKDSEESFRIHSVYEDLYTIIMKYEQFMSPQLIEYKKVIMDKFT